ncbi:hypothetical protein F3Y22_tig00018833pilonHSYRG00010 [Hibiscus syriacus]|uniref:RNase H type-1 domain-containing protein n=1 Tax=Hibiscus syriacus TaxID=106335 RepID=A0A6A3BVM4_HIBSY|nr:hypothetical protein F3Y22_tig00018833pilonHSYRG00010 [Hibiscus syriacus]
MVIKKIESIRRSFLWGYSEGKKKLARVCWRRVCLSRHKGGAGVINLQAKNQALLEKWGWRFTSERKALWRRIINSKYGSLNESWNASKLKKSVYGLAWDCEELGYCKRISVAELAVNGELCLIHLEGIFTRNLLDREKAMLDVLKEQTHDMVLKRDVFPCFSDWSPRDDKVVIFSVERAGCDGVLHVSNGSIRAVFTNNVQVAALDHVKLGVVLLALKVFVEAGRVGVEKLVEKTDSMLVLNWIENLLHRPWKLWPACLEIDSLSKRIGKIKFSLIERNFSRMDAWLAVDGMSRSSLFKAWWYCSILSLWAGRLHLLLSLLSLVLFFFCELLKLLRRLKIFKVPVFR